MPESNHVQVLLATYQGERFLREQVASILDQEGVSVSILARDDRSRDSSYSILEHFAREHPTQVTLIPNEVGTGHAKWNFVQLMQASTGPYVALADQDDVWLPNKLQLCMDAMRELERQHGALVPLLVFTDLTVVDHDLCEIHDSFWKHQHIDADRIGNLPHLLAQNVVTGCTALMNRALVERSLPMPTEAFMHDWWIALNASVFGHARALHRSTILYRQHGSNAVGAVTHGKPKFWPSLRRHGLRKAQWEMGEKQAEAFLSLHGPSLPPDKRRILEAYVRCEHSPNRLVRVWTYIRYRFFQKGLRPNLAMLWYLWDMKAAKRLAATDAATGGA